MLISAPESDDFVASVLSMPRALGWVVEIPRHGPGCRQALENMDDKPKIDEENMVGLRNSRVCRFFKPNHFIDFYSFPNVF